MLCCVLPLLVMAALRAVSTLWNALLGTPREAPMLRPPAATRRVEAERTHA